jgi:hypothetical protein
MPSTIDPIENIDIAQSKNDDPEKIQARVTTNEPIGNQIPHEMLEVLAPNGETEFILDKINNMTEDEALDIIQESLKFHADDWNCMLLLPHF